MVKQIYFHLTACVISSDIKDTFKFSLFAIISNGIIFNIPLTLHIFFLTLKRYGSQIIIKTKLIIKIKTINFVFSICI